MRSSGPLKTSSNASLSLGTLSPLSSSKSLKDAYECSMTLESILENRNHALHLISDLGIPSDISQHMNLIAYGSYGMIFKTDDVKGTVSAYANMASKLLDGVPEGEWKQAIKEGHFTSSSDQGVGRARTGVVKIQVITSMNRLHEVVAEDKTHQLLDSMNSRLRGIVPKFHAGFTVYEPWPSNAQMKELVTTCQRALPGLVFRVTIMELIEGHVTLSKYVSDYKPEKEARKDVYRSLRNVLLQLWASGLVHCDLHAGNILVQPVTRQVKLIDFGFAKQLRQPDTIKACRDVLAVISSKNQKNHEAAVKSYGDCTERVKAEVAHYFKSRDMDWYHLDMNMLRGVRQWVKDPTFNLKYTQGFQPLRAAGEVPKWVNLNAVRARNQVANANLFEDQRSPAHKIKVKVKGIFK